MAKHYAFAVLALFGLAACGTTSPSVYPRFDWDKAKPAVAVVDVSPGAYLPELDECTKPDVICLHSPFWFNARVKKIVYGDLPSNRLKVTTLSHYGMDGYTRTKAPWLVSLATLEANVVMPRYAADELVTRKNGELFLLIRYPYQPAWLPCSVATLRQPIQKSDFPHAEFTEPDEYVVRTNPDLYLITRKGAFPKYGIGISELREHMALINPSALEIECEQDAE